METPPEPQGTKEPLDELGIWSDWLNQAAEAGLTMAQLFATEIHLALGDARRMLFLAFLTIPLVLLTWLGLSVLVSWLAGSYSGSVTFGLLTFVLLHGGILLVVRLIWLRYKRSLSLPMTRRHLQAFMGGMRDDETQTPDS